MSYAELNKQIDHQNPRGRCYYMTVASLKAGNAQVGRNFGRAQDLLLAAHPTVCSPLELEVFHLAKVSSVPVTDMAHAGRTASKFGVVKIYWNDGDGGSDMRDIQEIGRKMVDIIESDGSMGGRTYTNLGKSTQSDLLHLPYVCNWLMEV